MTKKIGRPFKNITGNRTTMTVTVRADLKRALIEAANLNERTQNAEAEHWFEELETYRDMFRRLGRTPEQMLQDNFNVAWHKLGWRRGLAEGGEVLFSPDHPKVRGLPPDGFVPIKPGDPEEQLEAVEALPPEELSHEEIARNIRDLREKLAGLDALKEQVARLETLMSEKSDAA